MSMSAGKTKDNYEELPLLDSFLKESARKNPLDSRKSSLDSLKDTNRPLIHLILSFNAEAGFVTVHVCRWDPYSRENLDSCTSEGYDGGSGDLPESRYIRWVPLR